MAESHRRLPQARDIPWTELRRRAVVVALMLQAGWNELTHDEREEGRGRGPQSRGRPRRRLGSLAGKPARAAAGARKR